MNRFDIGIFYDAEKQEYDIRVDNSDIVKDYGMRTAVYISLFCNSRAGEDGTISNPDAREGWWGDLLNQSETIQGIGSNLWQLKRSTTAKQNVELAEQYCQEALQWMIDDGIAADIAVTAEQLGTVINPVMSVTIEIFYSDGNSEAIEFADLWTGQFTEEN